MGSIASPDISAAATAETAAAPEPSPASAAAVQPPVKKLKSLKFFYIGLAWAFGYPTTAMLIGYAVSVTSGGPPTA